MNEGKSSDGVSKKRNALGDVTNLIGKREFLGDIGGDVVDRKKGKFVKQVCSDAENIDKQNVLIQGLPNDRERGNQVDDFAQSYRDLNSLKAEEMSSSYKNSGDGRANVVNPRVVDVSKDNCVSHVAKPTSPIILDSVDAGVSHLKDEGVGSLGEHCVSNIAKPTSPSTLDSVTVDGGGNHSTDKGLDSSSKHCVSRIAKPSIPRILDIVDVGPGHVNDEGARSLGKQSTILHEQCDTDVCGNDENELGDDNLDSSKCESTDCFRFPESQESRSGFERCVGLNGDGLTDSPIDMDLIKGCSCSFCTKAAYIWSDLHYQDIKGRLAALKKSQKDANILVQRCSKNKSSDIHGQAKPDIQSSLMGQWRSLFLHMEEILGRESSQLENGMFTLKDLRDNYKKDLRDNYKTELESINAMPSENP